MSQQIIYSLCFQTKDAVASEDGEFTFVIENDNPRLKPHKVALGSLEFPITQYSVEASWQRVYFCERLRITPGARQLEVRETVDGVTRRATSTLPLHLNPITRWTADGQDLLVEFEEEHGF